MLSLPHIRPLAAYAQSLRQRFPALEFPDFDPLDGGVGAQVLFLLEKPGPMTSALRVGQDGSGFISRDNDDATAEASFRFMNEAGLVRKETVIWNVIPGWNGTRKVTTDELRRGAEEFTSKLLPLLSRLHSIVLVGRRAQRAAALLPRDRYATINSPHPSPLVRASQPDAWATIPKVWSTALGRQKE